MKKILEFALPIACIVMGILAFMFFHNGQFIKQENKLIQKTNFELSIKNEGLEKKVNRDSVAIIYFKNQNIQLQKTNEENISKIHDVRILAKQKETYFKNLTNQQADSLAKLLGDSRDLLRLKFDYDTCQQILAFERGRGLEKIISVKDSTINIQDRTITDLKQIISNKDEQIKGKDQIISNDKKRTKAIIWQRNTSILGAGIILTLMILGK
jgi:hypothetical protein